MILLSYAAFANSIGAVVGRVTIRTGGSVTSRSEGHCRLHLSDRVLDFADEQEALLTLKGTLRQAVQFAAQSAGAEDVELEITAATMSMSPLLRKACTHQSRHGPSLVHLLAAGTIGAARNWSLTTAFLIFCAVICQPYGPTPKQQPLSRQWW